MNHSKQTKKRLVILSDLWGTKKADWITPYIHGLQDRFDIKVYDCCALGAINTTTYTEENLHEQFINSGIEKAVQSLIQLEPEKVHLLAFSIGGIIAWKFGVATGNIDLLYCISSTRLRLESIKPTASIRLFYGKFDTFAPDKDWFFKMAIQPDIITNAGHMMYMKKGIANYICAVLALDKPLP